MKILFQSDDYGITRGAAQGCLRGIRDGVIRNTGVFTNMPWAGECIEWIRPYLDHIAFGVDLNGSTGPSLLGHDRVPALTHEDGTLYGSRENRAMDTEENDHDHLAAASDQLEAEFRAQIERYIELVGRKPDYLHNHAYGTITTARVTYRLAREYGVLCTLAFQQRPEVKVAGQGWYLSGGPEVQLTEDPLTYLTTDRSGLLASGREWGFVITHCGYADADLFRLTSFTLCRPMDLDAVCSTRLRVWIEANGVELATYRDLPTRWALEQEMPEGLAFLI